MPDFIGSEAGGKAGIAVFDNSIWATFNNPANLTQIKSPSIGINHHLLFSNSGLSQSAFGAVYTEKFANYGLGVSAWGYPNFKSSQISAAAGKKLNEQWTLGVNLAYTSFNLGDGYYGKQQYLKTGIGTVIQLPKKIKVGVYLQNIHRPKLLYNSKERDETFIKVGLCYAANKDIEVSTEAFQQLNQKLIVRVAMDYKYKEKFYVRCGISDNSSYGQFSFGVGQKLKKMQWNTSTNWHPLLGFSPQMGVNYAF